MVLLKKLLNSCFDEFFFSEREFVIFPHCDTWCGKFRIFLLLRFYVKSISTLHLFTLQSVEKWEILSHWKCFSSNQLFSNFFSKTIAFTKFLRKKCEREFLQFPHCALSTFCLWDPEISYVKSFASVTVKLCFYNIFSLRSFWMPSILCEIKIWLKIGQNNG